ncbi:MAG TPA: DUF2911 domain-containing protein [Gemmatimonadaceae bacterium]
MKRWIVFALALSACSASRGERYGFVTVLGRDTVAAERIVRAPRSFTNDEVDQWPAVRLRHTEMALAPDGTVTQMVMDVRTPNASAAARRWRRVTANMTRDSVRISIRDSSGVKDTAFATGGEITVPHVSMMYGVIELEIATAIARGAAAHMAAGDSVPFRQFYPDRDIGPTFVLHSGWVHPVHTGQVELWHDWLSGIGDATVDSTGRMLTYSGQRSTYKVEVKREATPPDVEAIGAELVAREKAAGGIKEVSVRDTARGGIGAAAFTVDYGRPRARGRELLGNVIDYDDVWRTGANAATQFTTSRPITLAGLPLPAGKYTLWTVPHKNGAELIVNKETGQWGTDYDRSQNLGRAPLRTETVNAPVDEFTISIVPADPHRGSLVLEWGTFKWTAPIVIR